MKKAIPFIENESHYHVYCHFSSNKVLKGTCLCYTKSSFLLNIRITGGKNIEYTT